MTFVRRTGRVVLTLTTVISAVSACGSDAHSPSSTDATSGPPSGHPFAVVPGTVYVLDAATSTLSGTQSAGKRVATGTVTVIDPAGRGVNTVPVGQRPVAAALVPRGAPGAGTLYVADQGDLLSTAAGTVSTVEPDGRAGPSIAVVDHPTGVVIAPAGAPNAGTVYVSGDGGISTIAAGAHRSKLIRERGDVAQLAVAPRGTPAAGTVYAESDLNTDTALFVVLSSRGRARTFTMSADDLDDTAPPVIAPAGTQRAGSVYEPGFASGRVLVLRPDGTRTRSVAVYGTHGVVLSMGTPGAGTVFLVDSDVLSMIGTSGASRALAQGRFGNSIAAAPAGVASAGSVYVTTDDVDGATPGELVRYPPHGGRAVRVRVGREPSAVAVASAGTPAGAVYVANELDATVSVITPGASRARTVAVGRDPVALVVAD